MSLLNVVVGKEVGWMCVDTTTWRVEDRRCSQQSKMLPLVHVNAVVGCRGDITFLSSVFYAFMDMPAEDFDGLAQSWSQRLEAAMRCYEKRANVENFDPHAMGSHIALLGWSNARGHPLGLVALRQDGRDSFDIGEMTGPCLGPHPGHEVPSVPTLQAMESLSREQVSKMRHDFPGAPIGGRLLLAEVTRECTSIRQLATLG